MASRLPPFSIRVIQILAICSNTAFAYHIYGLTEFTVGAIMAAPASKTPTWITMAQIGKMHHYGRSGSVNLILFNFALNVLLAADSSVGSGAAFANGFPRTMAFVAAAILPGLVVPWTIILLGPLNAKMMKAAGEGESTKMEQNEARDIVSQWKPGSNLRIVLPAAAIALSAWALFAGIE